MPIIKNSATQQSSPSSSGGYGEFKDISKTIWKNTVSMRENNEFAVFDFLIPLEQGDGSYFHPIPSKNPRTGNAFTQQVYCNEKNVSLDGRLVEADCAPCTDGLSVDKRTTYPRMRYTYWVLHYGTYHLETNVDLQEQKAWTQGWKQVTVGKQTFFRETVLKPQILELAPTTWAFLSDHAKRKGTIKNGLFEYTKAMSEGRINYRLLGSDLSVPDFSNQMAEHADALPSLQDIAAGLITEVNVPQFTTDKTARTKVEEADAFEKMANITEGEEF